MESSDVHSAHMHSAHVKSADSAEVQATQAADVQSSETVCVGGWPIEMLISAVAIAVMRTKLVVRIV